MAAIAAGSAEHDTHHSLHRLGMILTVAAVALLAATLADRSLAGQVRA